jgi:citrate lyase subunit beta / citryl-CoA lyase
MTLRAMTLRARSWLYVPATSPRLLDKAMAGAADAVVLDLEDSITASTKDTARRYAAIALSSPHHKPLWVRINHPGGELGREDVQALGKTYVAGVRVPKAEDPDLVAATAEKLGRPVHLLIESALGLHRAYELACCHPGVVAISLGETKLAADLRVRDTTALDWARQRVVAAARAAKLTSPVHCVWTDVRDTDGLLRDTLRARDQGFFGRSVIHPSQVEVVNRVFTPDEGEVRAARTLVNSLRAKEVRQVGTWLDDGGRLVDEAVVAHARWLLDLAAAFPATARDGHTDQR